jgi:cytochrome c oxidase subunit 2
MPPAAQRAFGFLLGACGLGGLALGFGGGAPGWLGFGIAVAAVASLVALPHLWDAAERHIALVVAIVFVLVAAGTVVFHVASPWWWPPIASNWGYIDSTINLTFLITGAVFAAVTAFTAYCVWRFRYDEKRRAAYEPENPKLELWLTIATAVGVAAMLAPGLLVWREFVDVPDEAHEVEIIGRQWSWSYRMPGDDGVLGASGVRHITVDNPLGLDPSDPASADDVIVDFGDLHLPVDRPVKLLMRSLDVLHNYYVPQFRAKMDMVPGTVTFLWLTPTRSGTFEVLCAELCGVGHAFMRGGIRVVGEAEYAAWLAEQPTFAARQSGAIAAREPDDRTSTVTAGSSF